jgi:hypothetical protein
MTASKFKQESTYRIDNMVLVTIRIDPGHFAEAAKN